MILLRIMILKLIDVLGVRNYEKTLAGNTRKKCLEVEDGEISMWSSHF
jgi:hypothetical protein